MHSHPGRQAYPLALRQSAIQSAHGLDNPQSHQHRPLRIVFVGPRIAKVDQEPIPQILGNVPVQALDDLGTGRLIGPQHLAQIFGVKLASQTGGVH